LSSKENTVKKKDFVAQDLLACHFGSRAAETAILAAPCSVDKIGKNAAHHKRKTQQNIIRLIHLFYSQEKVVHKYYKHKHYQ
jgi:hypothetical protein